MDAHLLMNQLENEGIECWLKDENTVTIDPLDIYQKIEQERKLKIECPKCKGHNIELVSTPRKASNWITAIITFILGSYALTTDKVYHCFDCGHEFAEAPETIPAD